ncbi:MAG: hypothetical protein K2X12_19130, partial [Burkholderiaceae bacterium]|nr:hypothetical protein [Burkholderiaceae bacterium]
MATPRPLVFALPVLLASLLSACVVAPPRVAVHADVVVPAPVWVPPPPPPVVSVYVEPPLVQPAPVAIEIAPPPMLVEVPPPPPYPEAVWIGGYWGWHARWVWCAGRWSAPPQPGYVWAQPYYEHRDGVVVFVPGFWLARGVAFVPPPPSLRLSVEIGVGGGPRPIGPVGVFVPPPPGSRPGLVVPAPLGTPPAVVISAPPVTNVGMRVQTNIDSHNTTVVNHITNITNITNVTVVAPASATASGRAFQGTAPTQAHLAAAMPAFVHATAPVPVTTAPVPVYVPGHAPAALPAPQPVHIQAASATMAAPVLAPPHPAVHPQAAPDRPHLPAAAEIPHPAPH